MARAGALADRRGGRRDRHRAARGPRVRHPLRPRDARAGPGAGVGDRVEIGRTERRASCGRVRSSGTCAGRRCGWRCAAMSTTVGAGRCRWSCWRSTASSWRPSSRWSAASATGWSRPPPAAAAPPGPPWTAVRELSLMLAGAQLGITLCTLGLGALAEPAIEHLLGPAAARGGAARRGQPRDRVHRRAARWSASCTWWSARWRRSRGRSPTRSARRCCWRCRSGRSRG